MPVQLFTEQPPQELVPFANSEEWHIPDQVRGPGERRVLEKLTITAFEVRALEKNS